MGDHWNHNAHHHPLVLAEVPEGCGSALDVACGDGQLAGRLAAHVPQVTGVDRSPEMIRLARERHGGAGVRFVEADFLEFHDESRSGGYDLITCVAGVHHMDFAAAIGSMVRLLAPGGKLVIIGVARSRNPLDLARSAAAVPAHLVLSRRHGGARVAPGMPTTEPTMSWGQVRRAAERLLPGSAFRRHLLWRYSLTWTKPGA